MSEPEIDELRDRWQADPSPALTLELADAYRRRGEHGGALEVLTAGLEANPDHVAARVAKGRCHLELEQVDEAIRELAPVVIDDPAHLVANQLLADAHARQGEHDRARDRLELFELLGGSASEVEEIERRLREPAEEDTVAAERAAVDPPEDGGDGDLASVEPVAVEAVPPEDVPPEPPPAEPAAPEPPATQASDRDDGDMDPFVLLDWIEFDESRYAAALFTEGIFAEAPEVRTAAGAATEAPAAPASDVTPTLTLGELYRKQGHHDEAVGIFREILARQPGNVEAARALGELEKEGSWPLSAEDLLGGAAEPAGRVGASSELLKRYRERLRGKE